MFDWLSDAVDWIGNSVSNATENAASAFSETILYTILEWIYSLIFDTISQIFVMLNTTSAGIFQLGWANAFLRFFYCIGWALFAAGVIVAVFDTAIEYQNGRGSIPTLFLNILKGFMAAGLFSRVPPALYSFCISLQGTFANDLAAAFFGESFMDIGRRRTAAGEMLPYSLRSSGNRKPLPTFAAQPHWEANRLRRLAAWCKQVIALCLTSFLQTTLLFLGLLTWQTNMILAIGVILSANEVPRIAQQFGLDTSVHVNMMSVTSTVNSAVRAGTMVARAVK